MPPIPRRVVTGHDDRGVSVFADEGPVPVVRTAPDGALFYEIWSTTVSALTVPPPPNGTKIRINEFPAGVVSPMHRTQSVDYGIVVDGEVVLVLVLVLDDSETTLRPGDVVVQRGTAHRWENRTERTARMAFILIDGVFTDELLATLGGDVLGGLLHDPMQGGRLRVNGWRIRGQDDRHHRRRARPGGRGGGDPRPRGCPGDRCRRTRRRGQGPSRAADGVGARDDGVLAARREQRVAVGLARHSP